MSAWIHSLVQGHGRLVSVVAMGLFGATMLALFLAPTSSSTYDFVVSSLVIDADDTSPAAGFNLDGRYSTVTDTTGCSVADRVSDLDSDQNQSGCQYSSTSTCQGGVDNVLPRLVDAMDDSMKGMGTPIRTRLASLLSTGRIVLLMRVEGVDSLTNDGDVSVSLYHGYSADSSCSSLFSGSGQFYIANDSLSVSGDPSHPYWQAQGSIVSGRLQVRYGSNSNLAAEAPTGFLINQLALRATLNSSGQSATNGNAGGWLTGTTLRDMVSAAYPRLLTILNGIIPQIDDLPNLTSGSCGGGFASPAGGAGVGVRFQLAQATVLGTASQHPSGTCGAN